LLLLGLLLPACAASLPAEPSRAPAAPPIEVAVTVDDLPLMGPAMPGVTRAEVADHLLDAFRRHRLPPVYGFVNGKKLGDDPAYEDILRRWLLAGNPLANHTFSHPDLNDTPLPDYLADIERGEAILRKLQGDAPVWKLFRYPFLHEGDTEEKRRAVRAHLREHGYTVAEVSIDADDWAFGPPLVRCAERGEKALVDGLHRDFVTAHVEELHRAREIGRLLVGREIKHVLLLHVGAADADAIDDLLSAYEREGVRWIDLPAALADPFYALDPGPPVRYGASFPYLAAKGGGVRPPAPPIFARDLEERLERTCP
jgi:peptidoglycan/xylan/chitin deacetylase (PgdA/CDA1 family)